MPDRHLRGPERTSRKIEELRGLGLDLTEIAGALGVHSNTVARWRRGHAEPRQSSAEQLEDLVLTARILSEEGELEPERVGYWLRSRSTDIDGWARPLDVIATRPLEVLRSASAWVVANRGDAPYGDLQERLAREIAPLSEEAVASALRTPSILGPDGHPVNAAEAKRVDIAITRVSSAILERIRAQPSLMQQLHWRDFEALIAELFERDGFDVTPTPASGDRGVDMFVAQRRGLGSVMYVVECKRYTRPIAPNIVREFAWVIDRHRATGGVLATTSSFTPGSRREQEREMEFRMTLADYSALRRWVLGTSIL